MLEARKYLGRQVGVHPTSGKRIFAPFGHCSGEAFDVAIAHGIKDGTRVGLMMDNRCEAGDLIAGNRYPGRLLGVHPTSGKRIFGVGCVNCGERVPCTVLQDAFTRSPGGLTGSYEISGCAAVGGSVSGAMAWFGGGSPTCAGYPVSRGCLIGGATYCDPPTFTANYAYAMYVACVTPDQLNAFWTGYEPYGWTPLEAGSDCIIMVEIGLAGEIFPAIITEFTEINVNPLLLRGRGRIGTQFDPGPDTYCACPSSSVEFLITE